jgi:hypothetical protein
VHAGRRKRLAFGKKGHSGLHKLSAKGPAKWSHSSRRETNSAWRRTPPAVHSANLISAFGFGTEPGVVGHFFGGHAFAPVTGFGCGQVGEGAFGGSQGLEEFEEGAAVGGGPGGLCRRREGTGAVSSEFFHRQR